MKHVDDVLICVEWLSPELVVVTGPHSNQGSQDALLGNCTVTARSLTLNTITGAAAGTRKSDPGLHLHLRLLRSHSISSLHLDPAGGRQDHLHLREEPAHEAQGHQPPHASLPYVGCL